MGYIKTISLFLTALAAVDARAIFTQGSKEDAIADSYIVVLKDGISTQDFDSHVARVSGNKRDDKPLKFSYDIDGWKGYSADFNKDVLEEILNDDKVKYVEQNRVIKLEALTTQPNAPSWGLGRISHRQRGNDDFVYDDSAGEGVTIYGIDTGIELSHSEFRGRIRWGTNTVDGDDSDGNGHGTHTAGTFAGTNYGIAKNADIVAVKVLNAGGSGTLAGVIQGIDWSVNDARSIGRLGKAVANLSLGGGFSQSVNDAAAQAVAAGVHLAVAAGNANSNADNSSPASEPSVCTVGSTTSSDSRSSFSNWGSVLDIYAPGSSITSAWIGGGSNTISGTSMAAPHVAGVAAALIAEEGVGAGQVCERMKALANGVVSNPGSGTTNKLLYNGSGR